MSKKETIIVQGTEIILLSQNKEDYISLTDMAKYKNAEATGIVISHWMSTRYTIRFMGIWEQMYNPDFNVTEFGNIKNESGDNGFVLTSKQWIERTRAIGIIAKPGRYGGGTFAHSDIAFEFATWLSPEFKFLLIKEFDRLKSDEQQRLSLEWNLQRTLSKINYRIHTDAIRLNHDFNKIYKITLIILFEKIMTINLIKKIKVQTNMESINALLIRQQLPQSERLV
jgi:hypothetical protein